MGSSPIGGTKLNKMSKQKQVKITITLEHVMNDDWYEGEGKSSKEKLDEYEEEFGDIEVLINHVLEKQKYGWKVKAKFV